MKLRIVMLVFSSFLHTSVFAQSCNSLASMSWLIGSWHAENGNSLVTETWRQVSDKTLEGFGSTRSKDKGSITSTETLRLVEMSDEIFYIPKVESNPLPVSFKLIKCSRRLLVFENLQHDFPNRLTYDLKDRNNLNVIVTDEKDKGFTIEYTRRKTN